MDLSDTGFTCLGARSTSIVELTEEGKRLPLLRTENELPLLRMIERGFLGLHLSSIQSIQSTRTMETSNDTTIQLLFKYGFAADGQRRLRGQLRGTREIQQVVPHLLPTVYGFVRNQGASGACAFYHLVSERITFQCPRPLPDPYVLAHPAVLGPQLACLHRDSRSPTGMFGFHCSTYVAVVPQYTHWTASWADFFARQLADAAERDAKANANKPWPELQEVVGETIQKVVPRLLGILEAGTRTVKPCLIHGDLWAGNTGTDVATGRLYLFDPAAYYAHHEAEFAGWQPVASNEETMALYRAEYERHYPPMEPVDEWWDRNRLYRVRKQLMATAQGWGDGSLRLDALLNMRYLVEKYGAPGEIAEALERSKSAAFLHGWLEKGGRK